MWREGFFHVISRVGCDFPLAFYEARMLLGTVKSCTRAGGASLNVSRKDQAK